MDDQLKEDLELIDCYTSGYAAGTKELRDAFARVAAKARLGAAVEASAKEPVIGIDADQTRDELARILETIAREGLDGPRDLDVALDAIESLYRDTQPNTAHGDRNDAG